MWRCRARLPNVLGSFLTCLMTARVLVAGSLLVIGRIERDRFCFELTFLETVGIGLSESGDKVGYSTLSTDLASPALLRLHFVISDFRPPSVSES